MGAAQSSWDIQQHIHDPIEDILQSIYNRKLSGKQLDTNLKVEESGTEGVEEECASSVSTDDSSCIPTSPPTPSPHTSSSPSLPPVCPTPPPLDVFSEQLLRSSPAVLDELLPYMMGPCLLNCMCSSTAWFTVIAEWIKDKCRSLDEQFEAMYGDMLTIDRSTLKFEPVYVAEKALRMDWIIYAKILPPCANKSIQIGYSFAYVDGTTNRSCFAKSTSPTVSRSGKQSPGNGAGSDRSTLSSDNHSNISYLTSTGEDAPVAQHPNVSTSTVTLHSRHPTFKADSHRANSTPTGSLPSTIMAPLNSSYEGGRGAPRAYEVAFQFNTSKRGTARDLWVHKDICRFHGDETKVAAMPSVGSVCVDDRIEVAVNLLNAFGLVEWESIRWLPVRSQTISSTTANRACPLENYHRDWFDMDRFQAMTTERLRHSESFLPYLELQETSFAGVDIAVRRSIYNASQEGNVGEKAERAWGMRCKVVDHSVPIICSLNRLGLQHDRGHSLQLRTGDRLTFYLSQGGANPG